MRLLVLAFVAVLFPATVLAYASTAKAMDRLDEQIAALEKENATLKKSLRVEVLQKENAELRKRLNVTTQSEPKLQAVRASNRQDDAVSASSEVAYAPRASRAQVAKAPEYYPPARDDLTQRWSGLYVGGHAGMGFGNWNSTDTLTFSGTIYSPEILNLKAVGAIAGGQAGYSWQIGHFVFGPEVDVSVSTVGKAALRNVTYTCGIGCSGSYTTQAESSINWLSSLRGRAGFAADNWLFFGSGGLAIAGINQTANGTKETQTTVGYAVGGGLSYAVGPHLALRAEYLRYQFHTAVSLTYPSGVTAASSVNPSTNVIRTGMDWQFN